MPTAEEKRLAKNAYMRAYYADPERREKKRQKDREYAEANRQATRDRANQWYADNRERAIARVRGYREQIQVIAKEAKAQPCMDCGQSYPTVCMQFHHRDPSTKKGEVSNRSTVNAALAEMAKCDIICANCHCIRHGEEDEL